MKESKASCDAGRLDDDKDTVVSVYAVGVVAWMARWSLEYPSVKHSRRRNNQRANK